MQIPGELLKLPEGSDIPLPWAQRGPLGLLHETTVYVALTECGDRPVGDLIVSVLDCTHEVVSFPCTQTDKAGVLTGTFEAMHPANIALAETATILRPGHRKKRGEARFRGGPVPDWRRERDWPERIHDSTIVAEIPQGEDGAASGDDVSKQLIADKLMEGGLIADQKELQDLLLPPVNWISTGTVRHGWIRDVEWRHLLRKWFPDGIAQVDPLLAAVSADTNQRLLRFVFPRRWAVSVSIKHSDEPGVLTQLTGVLSACKLNILTSFLRRGGVNRGDAELVAVCEPTEGNEKRVEQYEKNGEKDEERTQKAKAALVKAVRRELSEAIVHIDPKYRADLSVRPAEKAGDHIYWNHPDDIVARVPPQIRYAVRDKRKESERKAVRVFLSRKFDVGDGEFTEVVEQTKEALRGLDCDVIEAKVTQEETFSTPEEVEATMWSCDAGVVLVYGGALGGRDGGGDAEGDELAKRKARVFSANLASEYAFFRGQGKPVLLLTDKAGYNVAIEAWSNLRGRTTRFFEFEERDRSIRAILDEWIPRNLKEQLADYREAKNDEEEEPRGDEPETARDEEGDE